MKCDLCGSSVITKRKRSETHSNDYNGDAFMESWGYTEYTCEICGATKRDTEGISGSWRNDGI